MYEVAMHNRTHDLVIDMYSAVCMCGPYIRGQRILCAEFWGRNRYRMGVCPTTGYLHRCFFNMVQCKCQILNS